MSYFWPVALIWSSGTDVGDLDRARSFMRSIVSENTSVGLLLFDEPSASLDPVAEHGECLADLLCGSRVVR